ncbi:MAG: pyruvate dehydrogenase complex dihydrolipoamide acetyltransferase [Cyclonatronaceae bacterium]
MAIVIDMPKLSDTMEEGVISKWNVKEGDKVKSGDIIAEVETDKATMDVEVYDDGVVLKIVAKEGDAVPLGKAMAIIGEEGEDISDLLDGDGGDASGGEKAEKKPEKDEKAGDDEDGGKAKESGKKDDENAGDSREEDKDDGKKSKDSGDTSGDSKKGKEKKDFDPLFGGLNGDEKTKDAKAKTDSGDDRVKVSPLARKMAEEQGISLSDVKGSGPQGRIVKKDIEEFDKDAAKSAKSAKPAAPAAEMIPSGESKELKVSQMRKAIARRLAESKFTSPHFYETVDIDMKRAIEARGALNELSDVKISFNDFVVKACAAALRRHPAINSSWQGDKVVQHGDVHVAVAVAIDDGLITPVIKHTDKKGLAQISRETKDLAGRARDKKLQPDEFEGSTFTISNLGMFGIEEFTAIINPPNAAILAVGAIRDVPVVENGMVVPGKRMKVTLSSDHRLVDGATAAEFLNSVRTFLENPTTMLL